MQLRKYSKRSEIFVFEVLVNENREIVETQGENCQNLLSTILHKNSVNSTHLEICASIQCMLFSRNIQQGKVKFSSFHNTVRKLQNFS